MAMSDSDLSKSKIININDFIFRQNLEFYPNLRGLMVEDNVLKYNKDNLNINEVLTFDLRTLPGEVWNATPEEFINIVRINKECKGLYRFLDFINKQGFNTFINSYQESGA